MSKSRKDIADDLKAWETDAFSYLDRCTEALGELAEQSWFESTPNYYWSNIPDDLSRESEALIARLVKAGQLVASLSKSSLLVDAADLSEIPVYVKRMRSALRLKRYYRSDPDVVHDEGQVLGFRTASQGESGPLKPSAAKGVLKSSKISLLRILQLAEDGVAVAPADGAAPSGVARQYRPDTAFIMMWMSPDEPQLEDVRNVVKEVFGSFGIRAVRADDIEHEGIITQRIIDEINSSEFLFADLTGARPNVYYETGYAHALGKRVILFRKAGTGLHFDLAGYNCPEYSNMTDLKKKLIKRLSVLTNREVVASESTRPNIAREA